MKYIGTHIITDFDLEKYYNSEHHLLFYRERNTKDAYSPCNIYSLDVLKDATCHGFEFIAVKYQDSDDIFINPISEEDITFNPIHEFDAMNPPCNNGSCKDYENERE